MPNQVAENIKHDRVRKIMEIQSKIQAEILEEQVGKTVSVLFETYEEGVAIGHTPNFIEVTCKTDTPIRSEVRRVVITEAVGGKCIGELC